MMNKKLFTFTLLATTLPAVTLADVKPKDKKKQDKELPILGVIDSSVRFSKARNIGEINLLTPYKITDNSVNFINYIGKRSNKNGMEFNLGIARRKLEKNKIYGQYAYLDIRKTPTGNSFTQLTIGGELLSKSYDMRINAYLPISGKKAINDTQTIVETDNIGNINAITEDYEIPMWGGDFEYGKLIKEPGREFGAWFGYYHFRPITGNGDNINGGRLRAEYRIVDLIKHNYKYIFGFELQRDKLRGTQRILSFRLSIPFGKVEKLEKVGQNYYNQRILEPIVRDIDIVTFNNKKVEPIIDRKTNKPLKKVTYVANQKQLSDAILGDKNQVIVITKDFETGSMLNVGEDQIIISGDTNIAFKTASGYTGSYKPSSGSHKKISAKHNSQKPLQIKNIQNLRGVVLSSKNHKGEALIQDVSLLEGSRMVVKKGDEIAGMHNSIPKADEGKSYSLICSMGGEVFSSNSCTATGKDSEGNYNGYNGVIEIDDKTGKITVKKDFPEDMPMVLFKVEMKNADDSKVASGINIFSDTTAKTKAEEVKKLYLPNEEDYRGIRLLYGNSYKCSNDSAGTDGVSTCTTTGKTKIAHVKSAIDGILDNIGEANGDEYSKKIELALKRNDATMTLYNNDDDKGSAILLYTQLSATQDLQSTETFATNNHTTKGKGANNKDDATLEEVLHLVQNYGIMQSNPEWQDKIVENMNLYQDKVIFNDSDNDGYDDGGDNLPLRDLNTEYFAGAVEAYYNLHSRQVNIKASSVCLTGSADTSKNCSGDETSRKQLLKNHKNTYDLLQQMFGKGKVFYK